MVKQTLIDTDDGFYIPDADKLITEDDTPIGNFASEKQQRLLVGSLYSSLQKQPFLAAANVGVYYTDLKPAIVPDSFPQLKCSSSTKLVGKTQPLLHGLAIW